MRGVDGRGRGGVEREKEREREREGEGPWLEVLLVTHTPLGRKRGGRKRLEEEGVNGWHGRETCAFMKGARLQSIKDVEPATMLVKTIL